MKPYRYYLYLTVKRQNSPIEILRSGTNSASMVEASWNDWGKLLGDKEIEAYRITVYDKFKVWLQATKNPQLLKRGSDPGKPNPEFLLN